MLRWLLLAALGLGGLAWAAPHPIAPALLTASAKPRAARALALTYDDLHPLHGGERFVLSERVLTHTRKPRGGAPAEERRVTLTPVQLQDLAELLHDLQAWEQQTPERKPRPDESRTRLTVALDGQEVSIWEWHNALGENRRLIRVRDRLRVLAAGA